MNFPPSTISTEERYVERSLYHLHRPHGHARVRPDKQAQRTRPPSILEGESLQQHHRQRGILLSAEEIQPEQHDIRLRQGLVPDLAAGL